MPYPMAAARGKVLGGDTLSPTLSIALSKYAFKIGDTAVVTFAFSEAVKNFTTADITAPNGTLSSFTVMADPKIYTATFTPTNGVTDATNVITVGVSWTDLAGNPPAGSTTSNNYEVDTVAPTCTITCSVSSPSSTTPITFTYTWSENVTGFTVGDAGITNGTKGDFTAVSASVYTLAVTPLGMSVVTATVAAGVCTDNAGNANTEATPLAITSTAPFSDAFTRADGAIGSIWTGGTWTVSTNAALNTPATLGAELVTNPGLEGTYSSGLAPNLTKNGSPNVAESADAHGGSKAQQFQGSGGGLELVQQAYTTTAGMWYRYSCWGKRTAGTANNVSLVFDNTTVGVWNSATYAQLITVFRGIGAQNLRIALCNSGVATDTVIVDDFSLKAQTLTELFATLPNVSLANVTAQVVVTVNPAATKTQAGLVINLDSISNPKYFVIAYLDGLGNAKLDKCVNGSYSNVINGAVTFNAANNLKVVKSGDNYSLYYGTPGSETQVGTTQAITSMNGTIHGLFSTYLTAKFDTYQLSATP